MGLYYYRARYYSPTIKRFISEDPIGLSGGLNEYAYVYGSPLNGTDPTGRVSIYGCVLGADIAAGAAGVVGAPTAIGDVAITAGAWTAAWGALGCAGGGLLTPSPTAVTPTPRPMPDEPCDCAMPAKGLPPGFWPGDKGGEEWGRRNGVGADAGRRRFHKIKQDCHGKPTEVWGVNPDTGDVSDPEGETQGNLGDSGAKEK
jgi:uncharacterized protein RhaS with RHS repeats